MLKTTTLIISLTVGFHATFAQLPGLSANNLTIYNEEDGLPGGQISHVMVDRFGYIWVGTINGLARFDGYGFKRFYGGPDDPGLLVWSIFEDSKGRIWVCTTPSTLSVYDPASQSFRRYEFLHLVEYESAIEPVITTINEDDNGRIYFGVHSFHFEEISSALLYLDEQRDKLMKVESDGLVIKNINTSANDNEGNIWFWSYNGLLRLDAAGRLSVISANNFPFVKYEHPADFTFDKQGHLWIITNLSRLIDFDPHSGKTNVHEPIGLTPRNSQNSICMDPRGNIWMGTNGGLYLFNKEEKTVAGFDSDGSSKIIATAIFDLEYDSFGSLWIGTEHYGLFKYEERSVFKSFKYDASDPGSLTQGWVDKIFETDDGKVWLNTAGTTEASGINAFDQKSQKFKSYHFKDLLPGTFAVYAMTEYAPGKFYVRTNAGLYSFSESKAYFEKTEIQGLPDSVVQTFFITDSRENQWVGSLTGLFKKSKGSFSYEYFDLSKNRENNMSSNIVTHAVESKKHGLWLLTNNGLFLYNYETGEIDRKGYDKSNGDTFVTQDINSFYEDPTGMAWVGTWLGGLSRYDVAAGTIKTYTINDGLPSMSIQGILADEATQNLWLSSFEGLSRFNIPTEQFYNYSVADGIQGQLFADGSFLKSSKGLFFFGGSNGFTMFNPSEVIRNSVPPKVFLTDVKLFGKSLQPGKNAILEKPIYDTKEITLEHDQNNISLEFIALHYSNPLKNRYSYKLENFDDDWREVGNFRAAFYSNLPAGNYTFRVKAANDNGVWNEQGATLRITVMPPWWKTPWAYGIYAVLFLAGAFSTDKYMRQRLIKKENEKNRARELEHAKEIQKAYTELKSTQSQLIQSEKMASLGELTAGIAHEIQNPLNFVNNFSELNKELLTEMEEAIYKRDFDEVTTIARNIANNQEKINLHGKRAEGIVKGMLQHSRTSSGQKELTDINALCDEYLRLSYHGYRAKDKSFNSKYETNFEPSLPKTKVIPQDIGRVLLNLINNAFYAVNEKSKKEASTYEPHVSVSTKNLGDKIEIIVKDNGPGIPDSIKEKIFQPFFTTKPTGQGTGLGLSLSYDIVKAHGGELSTEANDGQGSKFVINLPIHL